MPMETLPLHLKHKSGERATVLLGGLDITRFVAADGLRIEYDEPAASEFGPTVTLTFARGRLDLDFDVDLLERLLADARAKAGE